MDVLAVSLHFECWMQDSITRALLFKMHVFLQSVSVLYNLCVQYDSLYTF